MSVAIFCYCVCGPLCDLGDRRRASASCERVLLLVPVYYFMAREMTRKELTDFVGQKT